MTADLQYDAFGLEAYAGNYDEDGIFNHNPYGIAASYDVTGDASVYVAYRSDNYAGSDNFDAITTLGGSYSLAGLAGVPIRLTGEVARFSDESTSFSDSEWNQFSVFASYDIGGGSESVFRGLRSWSFYYD